jgi:hypothetical protein
LRQTADYQDYHRLLNTQRMLTAIAPLISQATDEQLATEVSLWLAVERDLDPLPADTPPFLEPTPET